jgi:hypothetical protein
VVALIVVAMIAVGMMAAGGDGNRVVEIIEDHQCHMRTSLSQAKVNIQCYILCTLQGKIG